MIRKLKNKFIIFCRWIWQECKDIKTFILLLFVIAAVYSPVWGGYLLNAVFGWKWAAVMASVCMAFLAGPFTPFFPLCIGITLSIKRIAEKRTKKSEQKKMNNTLVIYVHGKGGNAKESEHYKKLFSNCDVAGFDYKSETPWDFKDEFLNWTKEKFCKYACDYKNVILVANSIGAFFLMNAISQLDAEKDTESAGGKNRQNEITGKISRAFFISPIVNMEKLICSMMAWAGVTENQLEEKKIIKTDFGENLSWEYLTYVRKNPIQWKIPTEILYGEHDNLTPLETVSEFARAHNANLTVMNGGEHWFHTDEQMKFLDSWIKEKNKNV